MCLSHLFFSLLSTLLSQKMMDMRFASPSLLQNTYITFNKYSRTRESTSSIHSIGSTMILSCRQKYIETDLAVVCVRREGEKRGDHV
ncbi:hypothetical protein F5X99DRAFT_150685 [Biscogniauxia marginata]|nr:hypothetical protein F5X99DRAFT_150685 [Biscogniauxia marginata]